MDLFVFVWLLIVSFGYSYGNSCINGVCVQLNECTAIISDPEPCNDSSELICCPLNATNKNTFVSNEEDESNLTTNIRNRFLWPSFWKPLYNPFYNHRLYDSRPTGRPDINLPISGNSYFDEDDSYLNTEEPGWISRPVWEPEASEESEKSGARRKRISQIKCEEYRKPVSHVVRVIPLSLDADVVPVNVQKCDFTAAKLIVGGVAVEVGEFPHMAAVGFRAYNGDIMWNCGGSLISEQFILTAGHCTNTSYGNPVVVRLGEHNLAKNNEDEHTKDYRVMQVIPHPRYKPPIKYNDIALLKLDRPVLMNNGVRPACLSSMDSYTDSAIATGWGRTDFVRRVSDVLMKVRLSIVNNKQCNNIYQQDRATSRFFKQGIVDSMLCAGELEGGKDTCFGDSGGPLQITDEANRCLYRIIGITSFGKVCGAANSPGVYTRVSEFLPWIETTVWG